MKNALHTSCDACGDILEGRKGTAEMYKDNISIKGSICLTTYDPETHWADYTYALEKAFSGTTMMHFCNAACLTDYLQTRKILRAQYKLEKADMGYGDYKA